MRVFALHRRGREGGRLPATTRGRLRRSKTLATALRTFPRLIAATRPGKALHAPATFAERNRADIASLPQIILDKVRNNQLLVKVARHESTPTQLRHPSRYVLRPPRMQISEPRLRIRTNPPTLRLIVPDLTVVARPARHKNRTVSQKPEHKQQPHRLRRQLQKISSPQTITKKRLVSCESSSRTNRHDAPPAIAL